MSFVSTLTALGFAFLASLFMAPSAVAKDRAVSLVSTYVELAQQGNDASELVSEHASVSVIGVGSPYVHAEFVDYFKHCAMQTISRAKTTIDDRKLRYVVGEFICRDGDIVEPLARIGFGVLKSKITRIDLNPDLYLAQDKETNR